MSCQLIYVVCYGPDDYPNLPFSPRISFGTFLARGKILDNSRRLGRIELRKGGKVMKLNVMEILKELPRTNCKECGEPTCMAFAAKLLKKERKLEECKPLLIDEHAHRHRNLQTVLQTG